MANDPYYNDGFYDNDDDFTAREDYREWREEHDPELDLELDPDIELDGDWEAIADSERDGYGFFDPNEGCYDDMD